jgi:hypothetical protein
MNIFSKCFLRLLFVASGDILLGAPSYEMKTWKTYLVEIPNFFVEFKVPPALKLGYGGAKKRIAFNNPEQDQNAGSLADGLLRKDVGTFFLGVVGDFRDWDSRVTVFVEKYDRSKRPIESIEAMADFAKQRFAKKYLLPDGREMADLGSVMIEKIGIRAVVVVTSADQYHVKTVKLKSGEEITFEPRQLFFVRLDDEVVLGISISSDNEKRLSPKWNAAMREMVVTIIENMQITPGKPTESIRRPGVSEPTRQP